jgi:hypothetical protein
MIYVYHQQEAPGCHAVMQAGGREAAITLAFEDPDGIAGEGIHEDFRGLSLIASPPFVLNLDVMQFGAQGIKPRNDYKDVSMFALMVEQQGATPCISGIVNLFGETVSSHRHPDIARFYHHPPSFARFFVPHVGATFEEIPFFITMPENFRLVSNQQITVLDSLLDLRKAVAIPQLSLSGPESVPAGGLAELQLCTDHGFNPDALLTVEMNASAGYLPRRALTVSKNSPASFKVRAADLEPGDTLTVKAGFRFYNNVAKKTLEVV